MKPVRWTLYHRLLMLGMLPAIAMFALMLLFFTQARLDDARQGLFSSTQLIADNLAPAVEFPVISGNEAELRGIITQTLERSGAYRIEVFNREGDVLASVSDGTRPDAPVHHFTSAVRQTAIELEDNLSRTSVNPLASGNGDGGRPLGEIRVSVSETQLAGEQQEILWTSAGIGLILFAGTFLFSGRLAYRLSKPIERLVHNVQRLPDEDPDLNERDTRIARELQSLHQAVAGMTQRLRAAETERELSFQELAQARDKAEQANRTKSDFLAMMSHELRTPLHGVIGMLQLLEEEDLDARQEDYLVTARRSTEDLLVIINDILDFSRIERGRLELEDAPFDPRSVIENCFASFRHDAEANHLTYRLDFTGDWNRTPEVLGDPGRLRQILAHLIGNAIKFTPEGEVTVTASWRLDSQTEGTLICEVRDSGSGIPSDRLGDMFSSFEQLDSSAARRKGGTGLGLPLVQRLVELMGGHIAVDSEPGCGSRFRFVIPMTVPNRGEAEASEPDRPASPESVSNGAREALVVEDNPVNQRVAARQLENLGFHVRCASNGFAAVDDICESGHRYDVILMDCQMPGMDGWEACRRIRACERQGNIPRSPIVAMTADVLEDTEKSCLDAGMDAYLPKPVRRNSLREMLRGLIPL
ncbi:MAG: ATP-binding protein [Pseudomonadota bacterium]